MEETPTLDLRAHRDPSADAVLPASPLLRIVLIALIAAGFAPTLGSIFGFVTYAAFALVAAVLLFRMPRQPIGWLLLAIGWSYALSTMLVPATEQAMTAGSVSTGVWVMAWLGGALGGLPIFLLLFVLAVIFPSGHFPTGRWGRASRVAVVIGSSITLLTMFAPTLTVSLTGGNDVDFANPLAIFPASGFWEAASPLFLFLVVLIGAAAISLVVRLRRSTGIERQQLRWLVGALGVTVFGIFAGLVASVLSPALGNAGVAWIGVILGLPLIPIAIGIAVLRYRLYEIDVLVNRTVLYGVATLVIAVAFGVANVFLQRLIEAWSGQRSDILAGVVGAGAALAFGPLIRFIRPVVDRILPSRAMLALLFTDIVGSTDKIVALGDDRWRRLLGRYRAAMRQELGSFGGHEVNTAGDSFFATFGTPSASVACARAMRDAAHELDLETRTGLHYGECELRGEQVSGLEVHAAARVMSVAGAGEIAISEALRDVTGGAEGTFVELGERQLKGVPEARRLYRLADA